MKLTGISFIGVDENTDLDKLHSMCANSPIPIEIGILLSPNKAGKYTRYPTLKFIKSFSTKWDALETKEDATHCTLSLHLCGEGVEKFLDNTPEYILLAEDYNRVQLNFSIKDYDVNRLVEKLSNITYSGTIVLQENKSKHEFNKNFYGVNNIDFLFDGSGGFGRVLEIPLQPIPYHYCGYAGGIGPDTVEDILNKIYKLNNSGNPFYLDMESKIRTDNIFSIEKCQQVIDICGKVKSICEYEWGD